MSILSHSYETFHVLPIQIAMASLEVPNSTGTDSLLARLIGSDEMETNVTNNGAIISRKGTIRGVQDSVKNTVQNFKKMKAKPDASPMLRRAIEVNIKATPIKIT